MEGTVIDVRTPAEFMGGHVVGSKNIPLQEILEHVEEIKKMEQPLVFVAPVETAADKQQHTLNHWVLHAKMEVLGWKFKVIYKSWDY